MLSAFLWKGPSLASIGAKVAWRAICHPKSEGGLGIKRSKDWNRVAMTKPIWTLLTNRDSIWAKWVHHHLIKNHPFWLIPIPPNATLDMEENFAS